MIHLYHGDAGPLRKAAWALQGLRASRMAFVRQETFGRQRWRVRWLAVSAALLRTNAAAKLRQVACSCDVIQLGPDRVPTLTTIYAVSLISKSCH